MKTFSGRKASQNPEELGRLVALFQDLGIRRYIEIGARHGDTFHHIMTRLPPDSVGVAVDLPGGAWGNSSSEDHLRRAVDDVNAKGRHAACIFGDSTARAIMFDVADLGPYDAVLIDGDHRYEGVKRDWEIYGDEREGVRLVAFHDIAGGGEVQPTSGHVVEVNRLWAEIKAAGHEVREFIAPGSKMGIGVVIHRPKS